jgi:hypothetical protein
MSTTTILVLSVQNSQPYRNTHKKGKAIPVRGRGGPLNSETSRFTHFLYNSLTDGGEVFSLRRRRPFTTRKIPGTHFC